MFWQLQAQLCWCDFQGLGLGNKVIIKLPLQFCLFGYYGPTPEEKNNNILQQDDSPPPPQQIKDNSTIVPLLHLTLGHISKTLVSEFQ